ncbi:hypothetical protein BH11PSE6_BH11PSE6_00050 [soil metagenome]
MTLASLISSASAVAVKSTTGIFTAVGIWTALIGGTVTVLVAYIRFGPTWLEKRAARNGALGDRIAALEAKVSAATETAHTAEMTTVTIVAVVQLLLSEIERLEPQSRVLMQAREMLANVTTGDFGMSSYLARLASIPVVRKGGTE